MIPEKRRRVYLQILERALLNIRGHANRGNSTQCALEADHVHNIPQMLIDDNEKEEVHYWNTMRAGYLRDSDPEITTIFNELWRELEDSK